MRSIRRVYFYAVAAFSLEVVVWGVVGLLRTMVNNAIGGQVNLLAGSLSLVLVGTPVFLIHWWVVQKGALINPEERAARLRGLFLYGVLLGTLIPIVQNGLAGVNRLALAVLGLQWAPMVGKGQTWGENLVAIAVNLGAAAYFLKILNADWKANLPGQSLTEMRRLYRFIWVIYGLSMTVLGVQQVLRFLLYTPDIIAGSVSFFLADGIALLVVGIPLWVLNWQVLQKIEEQPDERQSQLRLVVVFLLTLVGIGSLLTFTGMILYTLLLWALGSVQTFNSFLETISRPLSIAIPMGGVWAYYSRRLRKSIEGLPELPRRAGLRRLYNYILAAFGLGVTIFGLQRLMAFIIDAAITQQVGNNALRGQLAAALSSLMIGLPLWWSTWRPMQLEAAWVNTAGDYTRHSVERKAYLYLALFAGVIGVMGTAGEAIYLVINRLMGSPPSNLAQSVLNALQTLVLFASLLTYHFHVLRRDGLLAEQALAEHHRLYPVLVIEPFQSGFGQEIVQALQLTVPFVPVTVLDLREAGIEIEIAAVKAVILPSSLATHPPDSLRTWLADFQGERLLVPVAEEGWQWVGAAAPTGRERAQQAAHAIRLLAEGQPARFASPATSWTIVGYVLAGLFALQLGFIMTAIIISFLQR